MFCNPFVTLLIRHTLGAFGAILIQKGLVDQHAVDEVATQGAEVISGAVCTGGAVLWSVWDKITNQLGK